MKQFSGNSVIAMNADIPAIWVLLTSKKLNLVLVRDLNSLSDRYPLTEIAEGPFTTERAYGYHVLHGVDTKTKERKSLRIGELGVIELSSPERTEWYQPSLGAIRLYIPEEISAANFTTETLQVIESPQ